MDSGYSVPLPPEVAIMRDGTKWKVVTPTGLVRAGVTLQVAECALRQWLDPTFLSSVNWWPERGPNLHAPK